MCYSTPSAQCQSLATDLLRLLFPVITTIVSLTASLKDCITRRFAVDVSLLKKTCTFRGEVCSWRSLPLMLASLSVKHRATRFCYNIFHLQNQIFLFLDPWHCGLNVVDFLGGRNQCVVSKDLYVFSLFYDLHLKKWTSTPTRKSFNFVTQRPLYFWCVKCVSIFKHLASYRKLLRLFIYLPFHFKIEHKIKFYPVSSELVSMTVQKFELKPDWYHFYYYQWTQENCPPQQITSFSYKTCLFFFLLLEGNVEGKKEERTMTTNQRSGKL